MVSKRCGCGRDCGITAHKWHISLNLRRGRAGEKAERGVVDKYAFLLSPGQRLPVTKAEALNLEALVRAWVINGRPLMAPEMPAGPTDDGPLVRIATAGEMYLKMYVEPELKGVSEPGIVQRIIRECGHRPITALVDRKVARAYLQGVPVRSSSGANRNRHKARWSHFMNWCRPEYGLTGDSPFFHQTLRPQGLKPQGEPQRQERLRDGEDARLGKGCRALDDGGMMLGRYHCALDALLRRGEMLQLRKQDLRRERVKGAPVYFLHVEWTSAKSGKARDIPVQSPRLIEFLDTRRCADYTFGQKDGSPLSIPQFRTDWERVLLASGLLTGEWCEAPPGAKIYKGRKTAQPIWVTTWTAPRSKKQALHWHDLRHEGASRLHDHGVPTKQIQILLGHSSLATTERYLNIKDDSLVENLERVATALGL